MASLNRYCDYKNGKGIIEYSKTFETFEFGASKSFLEMYEGKHY
jgi:hypothetical protein